jgi:hypothetical protein
MRGMDMLCTTVSAAGFTFACTQALMVENTGNVPLSFNGLEPHLAKQADGNSCSATNLPPATSMTCNFVWTASAADAEAATSTIHLAVVAGEAGVTNPNMTSYTQSAVLTVPQQPRMSVAFEQLSTGPINSNGRSKCMSIAASALHRYYIDPVCRCTASVG